jgi:CRISPR-associated protein Cmr4
MSIDGCLYTFYTLTPLHAGAGDSAGAIDLPVQREKHTEYPVVYSSGMKGSLRCYFEQNNSLKAHVPEIFGKEGDDQIDSTSGKVIFTDAKILLFPARSSEGVFKWVICPFVLERMKRDLKFIGGNHDGIDYPATNINAGNAFFAYTPDKIVLEDFPITVTDISSSTTYGWILTLLKKATLGHISEDTLEKRLIIVSDDVFKNLVTTATQIIARNVLDKTTKMSENLWYEEVIPSDAVFYTILKSTFKGNEAITKMKEGINGCILQIGGNETIGYGFVKMSNDLSNSWQTAEVTTNG